MHVCRAYNHLKFQFPYICFHAGFLLPRGFPDSVTDDYITYQLWAFPCHIFVSCLTTACVWKGFVSILHAFMSKCVRSTFRLTLNSDHFSLCCYRGG